MGCGQSKSSSSSSSSAAAAPAASKTLNHRKPKSNVDHQNQPEVHFSNSPPFKDGRSAEDKANANNTATTATTTATTTTTTHRLAAAATGGCGGSGAASAAAVKKGPPAAAAAAAAAAAVASAKRGNGGADDDEDDVRLTDEVQMRSEEMVPLSVHAPLDTSCLSTNADRGGSDFSHEKQTRYCSSSSSSSCSSSSSFASCSSSSASSSVTMGSCRTTPTTRDRPSRLTSNLSNLTASQIEFFRMVDEKIAQGKEYESDEER